MRHITNQQGVRIIEADILQDDIGMMMDGHPACTRTGAKLVYIPEGGWGLYGYCEGDTDLRHWNGGQRKKVLIPSTSNKEAS